MSDREYRVVWKREGLRRATVIRQTRKGAEDKASRLRGEFTVWRDADPYGGTFEMQGVEWLDEMGVPPLEYLHIEVRTVGAWTYIGPGVTA